MQAVMVSGLNWYPSGPQMVETSSLLASVLMPIEFHDWVMTWAICCVVESPVRYQNSILNGLVGPPRSVLGSMSLEGVGVGPSQTPSPFRVRPASVSSCLALSRSYGRGVMSLA